jgi:integrase
VSRIYKRTTRLGVVKYGVDFLDANGVRVRKLVSTDKRIAKEILSGYTGAVARRQHLGVISDSKISLRDFGEEWKRRVAPGFKPRSRERWFSILDQHLARFFTGRLSGITAAAIDDYISERHAAGMAPATINSELSVLQHMLRKAIEWERLASAPKIKKLREPEGRTRWLTSEEIDLLLAAADREPQAPYLRVFITVALNTGCRRNELLHLTRDSIDWVNKLVVLAGTKSGKRRTIFLNDAAFDALRSLPVRLDNRLFPFRPDQASMAVIRTARKTGILDCGIHTLRHTFASHLAMGGVAQAGLQALLGHSDGRMTARYTHIADEYLKGAVSGLRFGVTNQGAKPAKTA